MKGRRTERVKEENKGNKRKERSGREVAKEEGLIKKERSRFSSGLHAKFHNFPMDFHDEISAFHPFFHCFDVGL